jgi:hypothetical protein
VIIDYRWRSVGFARLFFICFFALLIVSGVSFYQNTVLQPLIEALEWALTSGIRVSPT